MSEHVNFKKTGSLPIFTCSNVENFPKTMSWKTDGKANGLSFNEDSDISEDEREVKSIKLVLSEIFY